MSRAAKVGTLIGLAVIALVLVAILPGARHRRSASDVTVRGAVASSTGLSAASVPSPRTTSSRPPSTTAIAPSTVAPSTVAPPTTGPPTTVDPGTLPQTTALPSATDPAFRYRLGALWKAVVLGQPALGLPAFFPLSAYIQVKAISDPQYDYDTRLIADYDQDLQTLHARLGAAASTAVLTGISVPPTAQWILPGVEYNKGSYWRVYGAVVSYTAGGQAGSFTIASMISWRGQWYVVHLLSIR